MNEYSILDTIVIIVYLGSMILIGYISSKKTHSSEDFFTANRSLGPLVIAATICATMMSGSGLIGRGGLVYTTGMNAVLLAIPYPVAMLIYAYFVSPRIQRIGAGRHNIHSFPNLVEVRFGKGSRLYVSVIISFAMAAIIAGSISATATIFSVVGSNVGISYEIGAIISTIIFVSYTMFSGLLGVVYTDVVQFVMMVIFVFIAMPVSSTIQGGGLTEVFKNIDPSLFEMKVDFSMLTLFVTTSMSVFCSFEMWQRAFAAKDPRSARKGTSLGVIFFVLTTVVVVYLGLCGTVIFPSIVEEYGSADSLIPLMAVRFLPIGLSGLSIAGILAVTMSTADTYLLISAQTIVDDFIKGIKPDISEKQVLRLTKLSMPILALIAFYLALYNRSAYAVIMSVYSYYGSAMAVPALATLYYKKATKQGLVGSVTCGILAAILWKSFVSSNVTIPGCIASAIAMFVISELTYKKNPSTFVE